MRKTIYTKFIFAYLLFALFGFMVVATFSSRAINNLVTKTEADKLYKESLSQIHTPKICTVPRRVLNPLKNSSISLRFILILHFG